MQRKFLKRILKRLKNLRQRQKRQQSLLKRRVHLQLKKSRPSLQILLRMAEQTDLQPTSPTMQMAEWEQM